MLGQRTVRRAVVVACVSSAVAVLASLPLLVLIHGTDVPGAQLPAFTTFVMPAPAGAWFTAVGAFIVWRRPRNAVGWLLLIAGVTTAVSGPARAYAVYGLYTEPGSLPGAELAAWFGQHVGDPYLSLLTLVFLLVPDGRLPSRRWRPVVWLVILGAVGTFLIALQPGRHMEAFPQLDNPLGVGGAAEPVVNAAVAVGGLAWPLGMLGALASLVVRYRRADAEQRGQLKWVGYGIGLVAVTLAVLLVSVWWSGDPYPTVPLLMFLAADAALPGFIAVAIVRHRLFDIDVLIHRSLVYGVLSALIAAAWIGVATLLGATVARSGPAVLAVVVAVAAVLALQPARRRLDGLAERVAYGRRVGTHELLGQVGALLEHSLDAEQLAARLAAVLRDGLGLDWVRLRDPGDVPDGRTPDLSVPLTHAGAQIAVLEAGVRRGAQLTARDRALLDQLTGQMALALHNAVQARQLAESRERIVRAQDAERRRLGRNIHDGIQQQLVALGARLRLARNQLHRDPALADTTLAELQADIRRAVEDLRELSRGIHPSVLSDRGLLEAVESLVTYLPLPVHLVADPSLRNRRFAQPVEEAGYFVVSEGLANVLKHSQASAAEVSLYVSGGVLTVEVDDDGSGFSPADGNGSGLAGLQDRVDVLGGALEVGSRPGAGTTLRARLPLLEGA
jgi:signal transduction histidine kinase